MEYHKGAGSSAALAIFESGMSHFSEVEYARRYIGFLISINDDHSEPFILLSSPD